jgi:hypothetical protein
MKRFSNIFTDQRFKKTMLIAGVFSTVYILCNIFVVGGDGFVYTFNNNITIPLAIIATGFAFFQWNLISADRTSRLLWGGLMAGWALWTIAEILWVIYGSIYQEVPYPSPSDYFYVAGYIPMGYGLYVYIRGVSLKMRISQQLVFWGILLITTTITVILVVFPIVQTNDASNQLESALNIIYPLVDLFLLLIVFRLLFIYISGDNGFGWNLMATGFLLHSVSNLIFSYASIWGLYYPDLKVTLLSGLAIDVPYNLSYLLWFLGMYALRVALRRHRSFDVIAQPRLIPNTSIVIFLNGDDSIIEVSNNFDRILGTNVVHGKSLAEALHIHEDQARFLLDKIRREKRFTDHPLQVIEMSGKSKESYVNGVSLNPQGEYRGCALVLRMLFEDDYSLDETLSEYQKSIISHFRQISESKERSHIRELLLDYHLAYLKRLYNLLFQAGGAPLSSAFLERLQQMAVKMKWPLEFSPETLITNADYELRLLREALPILLETGRQMASQLTDPDEVEFEMQSITSQFEGSVHKNVAFYMK